MEVILAIAILAVVAMFVMIGINIIFDWAMAVIPIVAVAVSAIGIILGLCIALKNTISVYIKIFVKKGA